MYNLQSTPSLETGMVTSGVHCDVSSCAFNDGKNRICSAPCINVTAEGGAQSMSSTVCASYTKRQRQ